MSTPSDREIVITRLINAPRELVFDAWIDPVHVGNWYGPQGFTITTHSMDVRPGGVWRFIMHGPDGTDYKNFVKYQEVVRPERLVYDHGGEEEHEHIHFRSTITFVEQAGKTQLTMSSLFPSAEARNYVVKEHGAVEGGNQTLDRFEAHVASLVATS